MMCPKKPCRAGFDHVPITREGTSAIIEHADSTISTTSLTIGPEIDQMTNHDILCRACTEQSPT
jgi:hypothetical protein